MRVHRRAVRATYQRTMSRAAVGGGVVYWTGETAGAAAAGGSGNVVWDT
eukprot:gene7177-723_t